LITNGVASYEIIINVYDAWLRRELKQRICEHPTIRFSNLREEETLLSQDEDRLVRKRQEVPVYSEEAVAGMVDMCKIAQDLKDEVAGLRNEMKELIQPRANGVATERRCLKCHQVRHFKRNCPQKDLNP